MRSIPTSTVTGNVTFNEYHSTDKHYKSYTSANYDNAGTHYLSAFQADAEL